MAIKNSKFNIDEEEVVEIQKKSNEKYCTKCGTPNDLSSRFCLECGNNAFFKSREEYLDKVNNKYCVHCKAKVDAKVKFCTECGSKEFVSSKEELDKMYIASRIKMWEEKIKNALDELAALDSKKVLLTGKNKELNDKLKREEKSLETKYALIIKRTELKSGSYDDEKNKVLDLLNNEVELSEYKLLEVGEAEENAEKAFKNGQIELTTLTKEIEKLKKEHSELTQQIKNLKTKIKNS